MWINCTFAFLKKKKKTDKRKPETVYGMERKKGKWQTNRRTKSIDFVNMARGELNKKGYCMSFMRHMRQCSMDQCHDVKKMPFWMSVWYEHSQVYIPFVSFTSFSILPFSFSLQLCRCNIRYTCETDNEFLYFYVIVGWQSTFPCAFVRWYCLHIENNYSSAQMDKNKMCEVKWAKCSEWNHWSNQCADTDVANVKRKKMRGKELLLPKNDTLKCWQRR